MKRRSSEDPQGKEAVVLLGHGSRVPTAGQAMERVAARLRDLGTFALVEVCHMSMQEPTLADALETCAKEGVSKVVVVPYFLHEGAHIREDIPGMLREKAAEYPDMTLILGKCLGYDESLVDLVERRAVESLASSDGAVRPLPVTAVRWRKRFILSLFAIHYSLFTETAYAMHISEGILPFNWALLWSFIAMPFVAYGLYRLKKLSAVNLSFKPLVGLMAAVVFIISCMPIPVPIAGTCSHPCGTGISAILLGPAISILVAAVALLIQALFLAHGGLTTWGANIISMGVMGSLAGYLTFRGLRALKANLWIAGFVAGILADWVTYLTTSVELASGIKGDSPFIPLFWKILIAFIPTQLPLGILEGAMTAGMVVLLYKKRPDLLVEIGILKPEEVAI